jgi:hypothetical protein
LVDPRTNEAVEVETGHGDLRLTFTLKPKEGKRWTDVATVNDIKVRLVDE